MQLKAKTLAALSLVAIALLAMFVAACSGDVKEEDLDTANARIDELQAETTKGQLLAFRNAIRAEDLHGLDEAIGAADAIDESWLSSATRARQATASVTFPDEMKTQGDALLASLTALEDALSHEDLDAASTAATDAHDAYHELDHDASPYLAGETPAPEADHGAEASGSPEASEVAH